MIKRITLITLLLSICIIFTSFTAGLGGAWIGSQIFNRTGQGQFTNNVVITNEDSPIIDVAESASPAVVSIVVTKNLSMLEEYNPFFNLSPNSRQSNPNQQNQQQQVGSGSGFIISKDGYVVTNRHVISDTEANYTVVLNNGDKYTAEVIGRDTILDIAIVKIKADKDLPVLQLGTSSDIKVGQTVIAIGNSLGEFSNTVSSGIVSGLSRSIVAGSRGGDRERLTGVIQTDASINPGNSGGPLLDIRGNVIGVNVAIAADAENVGFAIPIDPVKQVIDSVIEFGEIVRPYVGVRYQQIDSDIAKTNNLKYDYGALVDIGRDESEPAVIPNSPAAKAGLRSGDIILEINGVKLTTENPLRDEVQKYRVGDKITLKYARGDEERSLEITLEKNPNL